MKHIFIINPISGNRKYKDVIKWIEDYFTNESDKYEIHITQYPGHAKEIASQFKGEYILYAVGGDGTANEVLNGMDFECQLALIPSGTGNDFYRNISSEKDIAKILDLTVNGTVKKVDIGKASNVYFMNCLNLGIDARVNLRVNEARHGMIPRKLSYAFYALVEVFQKYAQPIQVEFNGKSISSNALLASFMNGKWYGGGFKSGPLADLTDGYLEMSVVKDMPRWKILTVLPKYFLGNHLNLDVVTYERVQNVRVSSKELIVMGVDGEVFKDYNVDIEMLAGKLNLRVPREQM